MRSIVLFGIVALVVAQAFYIVSGLRRNINKVKSSGLPYIIAPCSPWFLPWQITHKLWLPLIKLLPKVYWEAWVPPLTPDFSWNYRYSHFKKHGDVFFLVSPGSVFLYVARAEVISQITTRRESFPKHTETYSILTQFGDNVLTSEGATWRMHRKVTAASFNEKNAALVWRESIKQSQGLVSWWTRDGKDRDTGCMWSVEHDTMRLALNIIGYVGFGLSLPWPNQKQDEEADRMSKKYGSIEPPEGFRFSFVEAMATLLDNVLVLLLVSSWFLRLLPFKSTREAFESRLDYEKFIDELLEEKIKAAAEGGSKHEGMDIMGQLVRSSYQVSPDGSSALKKTPVLSRDEITGNAFVMLVAGHETTANAIHFTILELAGCPASQRRLHKELDEIVGDLPPEEWDYEQHLNPLMASMVGACMNETLRILPPVNEMPKIVSSSQDKSIALDGQTHIVPAGTCISLCASSVHANPLHWPAKPSKVHPGRDDIADYVPERWFRRNVDRDSSAAEAQEEDTEDYGGYQGRDTAASLFRPERGAYIPFSDGARACLGRRIAQVEVIAALAVLFKEYSAELAVDEWATDAELDKMERSQQAEIYWKARDERDKIISGASSLLTLKLRGTAVPVRFVKRGEERFVNWLEPDREQPNYED